MDNLLQKILDLFRLRPQFCYELLSYKTGVCETRPREYCGTNNMNQLNRGGGGGERKRSKIPLYHFLKDIQLSLRIFCSPSSPRSRWPDRIELWSDHLRAHHVLGALKLHGLEKASSALLSGQWSGTCLIGGHFGLGRSDQRQFRAHTSLIRGQSERTLNWPETKSSEFFFQVIFVFFY